MERKASGLLKKIVIGIVLIAGALFIYFPDSYHIFDRKMSPEEQVIAKQKINEAILKNLDDSDKSLQIQKEENDCTRAAIGRGETVPYSTDCSQKK